MRYFKQSILKFKNDALSKVFYDIMKYLFLTFGTVIIMKFIPWIGSQLSIEIDISIWLLVITCLVSAILGVLVSILSFRKKYKILQQENQTDELTGLKNYKALEIDLKNIIDYVSRDDLPISLILIDIDNFKIFNQQHGFEIADKILSKLGQFLNKDSRITDETYRYFLRGDEFLIVAKQTTLANGQLAAERKRKLIADTTFTVDKKQFNLSVCCGVTEFTKGENKELLLERVNNALLKAKSNPSKNKTEIMI